MRRLVVCLACAVTLGLGAGTVSAAGAATDGDGWSGLYSLDWVPGVPLPDARLVLVKAPDADPAKLVEKLQSDLARWTLADPEAPKDTVSLRRFLPEEYAEWGWAGLKSAGRIECLDSARMFICRTTPGTVVKFGPEGPSQEMLLARTGVFGIALHAGAFELKKE